MNKRRKWRSAEISMVKDAAVLVLKGKVSQHACLKRLCPALDRSWESVRSRLKAEMRVVKRLQSQVDALLKSGVKLEQHVEP